MRLEAGKFRVDFSSNDNFVQVYRVDPSLIGGMKAVGTFVDKKFKPERNTAFDMDDLQAIIDLMNRVGKQIKW